METSLTLTVPKFLFLPPKILVAQNLGGGGGLQPLPPPSRPYAYAQSGLVMIAKGAS